MEEIIKKIEKLQYQMQLVGESLDSRSNPIASLVISMDWNNKDLDMAHDIFEKYDAILSSGEPPNWSAFENDFNNSFGVSYQSLKSIILAFHRNFQWTTVCEYYAKAKECVEFHEITKQSHL